MSFDDSIVAAKSKTFGFEDVDTSPYGFTVLDGSGYAKLGWENFYVLNIADSGIEYYGNSGYITGTDGEQSAYNPYSATDSSIYLDKGTFTFESVQMTSGWNLKETVTIKGYDQSGDEIYSEKVKLTDKGPTDVELHWSGVSKVTFFYPDKFKADPDLLGTGNNVVYDNMVFSKIKGSVNAPDADAHKIVADGAFGQNSHHESITSVHHVSDLAHPVNLHLA